MTERTIDKRHLPDGPWQQEPDHLAWEHAGYACHLQRHPNLGHLCGYVGLTSSHPYYQKHYDDIEGIQIHGGLTYSDWQHIPVTGLWVLGFDCGHCFDLAPYMLTFKEWRSLQQDVYRDIRSEERR